MIKLFWEIAWFSPRGVNISASGSCITGWDGYSNDTWGGLGFSDNSTKLTKHHFSILSDMISRGGCLSGTWVTFFIWNKCMWLGMWFCYFSFKVFQMVPSGWEEIQMPGLSVIWNPNCKHFSTPFQFHLVTKMLFLNARTSWTWNLSCTLIRNRLTTTLIRISPPSVLTFFVCCWSFTYQKWDDGFVGILYMDT